MGKNELDRIRQHLFERDYMSGVERDKARIKASGEVFTPKKLVDDILDQMETIEPNIFRGPEKKFVDPTCGDGEFLAGILYRKLEKGIEFEVALGQLFGVDIMPDNVSECRRRLSCGKNDPNIDRILRNNIRCENALKWFKREEQQPELLLVANGGKTETD